MLSCCNYRLLFHHHGSRSLHIWHKISAEYVLKNLRLFSEYLCREYSDHWLCLCMTGKKCKAWKTKNIFSWAIRCAKKFCEVLARKLFNFFLYKKIGLFGTLFSSKILLALIFAFFIDFTIPNKFKYFWLFNPIIWVFAISQADFTLLGFLSFGFGLYFYRQFEFQNAFFIWGLTALFGFEYVLLILFITSLEKKYNYLMYSIISSIIWVILIWDNQAIYSYFFISSEQQSLLYQFFPSLKEYNFYLSILLYFTLGTITIVSGLLLSQSDSNDIKKNNNSYFEWLRTKRNNLFLFSSILLILFIQNSFNYTLIWSFFAAISASQFYYLEHFNFNNN